MTSDKYTFFGYANFRGQLKKFGIKPDDRRRHMYVIGKTGMGKSEVLQNLAIQDIINGNGMAFIDPHGDAAERLIEMVPENRIKDVVYFNPADTDFPFAFNVMESVDIDKRHLVTAGLMGVFKKIWPDVWSARMEYILNNTLLALMDYPEATLLGINWMFSDLEYREKVVGHIQDPVVKNFWTKEYARYNQRYEVEATAAIQNKIGQFISNPLIRNIVGQPHSSIDIRHAMDEEKIIILNLSKGRVGEDNSRLLGAMLVTKIYLAAMSRVDIAERDRKDFYLYVDEFQNFATEAFVNILSEARKYRLCLILAHQYIAQMEETVRDAVFGNMGTLITFRIGAEDSEHMEKEFAPTFMAADFVTLPKYTIYLKLMVDGLAGSPFSANTLPPWPTPPKTYVNEIIEFSRKHFATPREIVDKRIADWANAQKGPEQMPGGSGGRGGDRGGGGGGFSRGPGEASSISPTGVKLYDAKCTSCGKEFKVPFVPDPSRPLYCKTCLKTVIEGKQKPQSSPSAQNKMEYMSLTNIGSREAMPFFMPKEKDDRKKQTKPVDTDALKDLIERAFDKSEGGVPQSEEFEEDIEDHQTFKGEDDEDLDNIYPFSSEDAQMDLPDLDTDGDEPQKGKLEPGKKIKFEK